MAQNTTPDAKPAPGATQTYIGTIKSVDNKGFTITPTPVRTRM